MSKHQNEMNLARYFPSSYCTIFLSLEFKIAGSNESRGEKTITDARHYRKQKRAVREGTYLRYYRRPRSENGSTFTKSNHKFSK